MKATYLLLIPVLFCVSTSGQGVAPDALPATTTANNSGVLIIDQPIPGRATNDTQQITVANLMAGRDTISGTNILKLGTLIGMMTNTINPIYALEGREMNLYFKNVISYPGAWDDLALSVACTKGTWWKDRWSYTPTAGDAGTTTFTLSVLDKTTTNTLISKTCSLITRALAYPSVPVSRRVLVISDSTGAGPLAEVTNLFIGDSKYTLTLVGSNRGNQVDSLGNTQYISCECISGWSYYMFNTDSNSAWTQLNGTARTGSPFIFDGIWDFPTYLATNAISLAAGDWVLFNSGINDIFHSVTDAQGDIAIAKEFGALTNMIAKVKSAVPGIRIGVCLTIPHNASQDGFGYNYGTAYSRDRAARDNDRWVAKLLATWDTTTEANVFLVPLRYNLDCVNNFQTVVAQLSARNTNTYVQPSNALHPSNFGQWQIADTYRSFLKGVE